MALEGRRALGECASCKWPLGLKAAKETIYFSRFSSLRLSMSRGPFRVSLYLIVSNVSSVR